MTRLLLGCSLIAIVALPIMLVMMRRWNISLMIFYAFAGLSVLGGLAGGPTLASNSPSAIIWGIVAFGIAASIEFAVRGERKFAIASALILWSFAWGLYYAAEAGAFA